MNRSKPILPPIHRKSIVNQNKILVIKNGITMRTIINWFSYWNSWQREIVLHGIVSKCSEEQLQLLSTVLEPLFHRDFVNCVGKIYPYTGRVRDYKALKKPKKKKPNAMLLNLGFLKQNNGEQLTIVEDINETENDSDNSNSILSSSSSLINDDDDNNNIVDEDLGIGRLIPEVLNNDSDVIVSKEDIDFSNNNCRLDDDILSQAIMELRIDTDFNTTINNSNFVAEDKSESVILLDSLNAITTTENTQLSTADLLQNKVNIVPKSVRKVKIDKNRFSLKMANSIIKEAIADLKLTMTKPITEQEIVNENIESLSNINNADEIEEAFCNDLFFHITEVNSLDKKQSLKPNIKPQTMKFFNKQLAQIWKALESWQSYERINLLSELVVQCSQDLLNYLGECMVNCAKLHMDINALPDRLLLKIFKLLNYDDITSCSRVCRRWRVLTYDNNLWMGKCIAFGRRHGLINMMGIIKRKKGKLSHVDWKLTYRELMQMHNEAVGSLALPSKNEWRLRNPIESAARKSKSSSKRGKLSLLGVARFAMSLRNMQNRNSKVKISRLASKKDILEQEQSFLDALLTKYTDKRPLMKPILGKLKQFQESTDVAIDIRPQLKSLDDLVAASEERVLQEVHMYGKEAIDVRGKQKSEAKERLMYKKDMEKLGQRGVHVGEILPILQCRLLQGHLGAVQCLQFDDRRLVTGSSDRSIRLWDVRSGRSIRKLYGHQGGVTCLHLRDNFLVTGSWDMTAQLWSLEPDFKRLNIFSGHKDSVVWVYILAESKRIVSASFDATVRVYASYSHFLERIIEFSSPLVSARADENTLLSAHGDRTLCVSDINTGQLLRRFQPQLEPILSLCVSSDLIVTGGAKGELCFWRRSSGDLECAVQGDPAKMGISAITYSRGALWTGHTDGTIREWNLSTLTCVRSLAGHKNAVRSIQVTAKRVCSASDDAFVRIWEFREAAPSAPENDLLHPKFLDQSSAHSRPLSKVSRTKHNSKNS